MLNCSVLVDGRRSVRSTASGNGPGDGLALHDGVRATAHCVSSSSQRASEFNMLPIAHFALADL